MQGTLVGFCSFLPIGLSHPVVRKAEYHFIERIFPAFLSVEALYLAGVCFVGSQFASSILDVADFCCFWSIKELFEQERRVGKGWTPHNPKRDQK